MEANWIMLTESGVSTILTFTILSTGIHGITIHTTVGIMDGDIPVGLCRGAGAGDTRIMVGVIQVMVGDIQVMAGVIPDMVGVIILPIIQVTRFTQFTRAVVEIMITEEGDLPEPVLFETMTEEELQRLRQITQPEIRVLL